MPVYFCFSWHMATFPDKFVNYTSLGVSSYFAVHRANCYGMTLQKHQHWYGFYQSFLILCSLLFLPEQAIRWMQIPLLCHTFFGSGVMPDFTCIIHPSRLLHGNTNFFIYFSFSSFFLKQNLSFIHGNVLYRC